MHMKVCPHCKGDGFWRRSVNDTHPQQNIAGAIAIFANGARAPAGMYTNSLSLAVAYEFPCFKCSSTGEIQWTRGKSMTPITFCRP